MTPIQIIATVLMIVPVMMMTAGTMRKKRKASSGLILAAAGNLLLFVLGCIATHSFFLPLLICLAIVILYSRKLARAGKVTWANPLAFSCSAIAFAMAVVSIGMQTGGCQTKRAAKQHHARSETIRQARIKAIGRVLGQNLAKRHALIIVSECDFDDDKATAVKALKTGIGDSFDIVDIVTPEGGEMGLGYHADQFDALLENATNDFDVVICLVNFPRDAKKMRYWKRRDRDTRPPFVLISAWGLAEWMRRGWCEGAVISTPDFDTRLEPFYAPGADLNMEILDAEAQSGFVYVDKKNLRKMMEQFPQRVH